MRVSGCLLALVLLAAATSCAARGNVRSVGVEAVSLNYEQEGAGPPLIALHGFGASSYAWRAVMPFLSEARTVYALDLKGFGKSPKPRDGRYALRDQAELVLRFIADLALEDVVLVGHSLGGGVALTVATELERTRPGTLSSLVLIDTIAYEQVLPGFVRVLRSPLVGWLLPLLVRDSDGVRAVLRLAYYNDDLIPDASIEAYTAGLSSPGGWYALKQTARQILPSDIEESSLAYSNIRAPTLLIWGRYDEIVPLSIGKRLNQQMQHSRLVVVENAGHTPHEETPQAVGLELEAFLTDQAR